MNADFKQLIERLEAIEDLLNSQGFSLHLKSKFGLVVKPSSQQAHVADPAGGGTQDTQARTAINSILTTLETFGFHKTS